MTNKDSNVPGNPVDPQMDMTLDMDLIKGSKGISFWMTDLSDIPKDLFTTYVFGKKFLDIGCGDGRIVNLAMRCGAKKFHGVEIDEEFVRKSPMQRHIKICDFSEMDFGKYDVLYYFLRSVWELSPGKNEEEERLLKYLDDFEGVLILYYRKVKHCLQAFHDKLLEKGFLQIENQGFLRIYRRET